MNIQTIIVICIVGALLLVCFISFAKRLSGKKSCCETTGQRLRRKKLKHVAGTLTVHIGGMRCENCRRRIESAINTLDGVSARVSLEKQCAVVSYAQEIDKELLRKTIENAGYDVCLFREKSDRNQPKVDHK